MRNMTKIILILFVALVFIGCSMPDSTFFWGWTLFELMEDDEDDLGPLIEYDIYLQSEDFWAVGYFQLGRVYYISTWGSDPAEEIWKTSWVHKY